MQRSRPELIVVADGRPARAKGVRKPADPAGRFRTKAQIHAVKALESLAKLATEASSEAVRVSAANSVIDRAHGRPAQAVRVGGGTGDESEGVELSFAWLSPEKS